MADIKRTLYFTEGMVPTQAEKDAAKTLGPGVQFRNAAAITDNEAIEDADELAGAVPQRYTDAYATKTPPVAREGETPPPVPPEQLKNDLARGARGQPANTPGAARDYQFPDRDKWETEQPPPPEGSTDPQAAGDPSTQSRRRRS